MTWRTTLAYWVLFGILAGYYALFEREAIAPPEPEVKREKVLPVFPDEIRTVRIRRGDREVRVELVEKRWKVVSPEGVVVPSDLVAALLQTVAERQEAEIIKESASAEDLRAFGLEAPSAVLEVELADGSTRSLSVGNRNPTRTAVYTLVGGSNRVMLAGLNVQYYGDLLFEAAFPSGVKSSGPATPEPEA